MSKQAKISKGNSKLPGIPNISTTPCKGCNHDAPCKRGGCYAIKLCRIYKPAAGNWSHNLELASSDPAAYFASISAQLNKGMPPAWFRWHIAGDILDQSYLKGMVAIAKELPATWFLVFTKMHHLDFRGLPNNLQVVFSMWPGWGNTRKRRSRAWLKDVKNPDPRIPADAVECPGLCTECGVCWSLSKLGKDVVFDVH